MRIYLFLKERIIDFILPVENEGSFSFDENPDEEAKLINIEGRNNQWVIYSTEDAQLINNNEVVSNYVLVPNTFYVIRRNNINYLIYATNVVAENIKTYTFDQNLNLMIGNSMECNVQYDCRLFNGVLAHIHYVGDHLVVEKKGNIYINNKAMKETNIILKSGDQLNFYGFKILVLKNMLMMNIPNNKVVVRETSGMKSHAWEPSTPSQNIEVKDVDLYSKDDYFSKSPRIRRIIETKEIKLSPPPRAEQGQELPLILTIGPMLTMGISSLVMLLDILNKIAKHQVTWADSWASLISSGAMLISMLLWPLLINYYNKNMQERRKQKLIEKYTAYLATKRKELDAESKLQKEILLENLIRTEDCLNIIKNKSINFWDKRMDQNDFLVVRIGLGNDLLDAKVDYPEEGFTIEEDELRAQADQMVEEFKYIKNVPVSYSLYDNKITAIMGVTHDKSIQFVNNILLQLITFYSYEDLKLVLFTNEERAEEWSYIKYLNHNFSNDRTFRLFSSTIESSKLVSEYLSAELNNRVSLAQNKAKTMKPHYVIIIDDYSRVKRHEFIKTLSEMDENLGFSVIILEEKLSGLPGKCSNFITLGTTSSGVLKNSYEKQEQIVFKDEINPGINMMEISKVLSNIPIEFENGSYTLPTSINFMEMEKVGKVEQLNILNRWNTNDSTNTLRAEVGVSEDGELMYLDLHEKYHGPHGLIAGTTGSGKSEFIITYILSMAINYSPDDVAFILIDYKGGGLALAFENKNTGMSLPHLAGTITNLDKAEMDRTFVSIDSEVKRRQMMFNEARDLLEESTMDIYKYQRYYHEGKLSEAIPHLFIICDEFAELKTQQPDFMDNLISVARIGRSLGIHLILATQKPSGVVNDQIWSNTKFRVCLKVQDEADSKEMLKRPEAAYITEAGRFYLQVGYDEYFALGQSGFSGAKYYPSEKIVKQVDRSINFIDDCGISIKNIQASSNSKIEAEGEQLQAILKSIIALSDKTGKRAKKLWLENIPDKILVSELDDKYHVEHEPFKVKAIVGEYDAPEKQEQGLVLYNYLKDGNTLVYGNDGSENELFLNTLLYSTVKNHLASEVNFYMVDYGSEQLRKYERLPHVGGMVFLGEDEKFSNLLKLIKEELKNRKKLFADYGGEYENYIKNTTNPIPLKVIILNNYDSIYEANQNLYDDLPDLVRDSERYGIIFIITAGAINSVSNKITTNFSNVYAYKLKDTGDYNAVLNVHTKNFPRDIFGRGFISQDGIHEFQTASILERDDELNDFLISFVKDEKAKNEVSARRIPTLPNIVRFNDVESSLQGITSIPIGISKTDLEIMSVDYTMNLGNIITSNRLLNTKNFVLSLLIELKSMNVFTVVIDAMKEFMLEPTEYPNYYNSNLDGVLDKLIELLDQLINSQQQQSGIIMIYGLNKFINKIDLSKFEEFTDKIKTYEQISIVVVDDINKLKNFTFESWFTNLFSVNDGIFVGRGVADQSLLHLSTITKEMTGDYKNDMGYMITDSMGTFVKLIDFISKEEDDEHEQ